MFLIKEQLLTTPSTKHSDPTWDSFKTDRKPEYNDNEDIKQIQESHYNQQHKKMNTFEQAKLDAIARLAATDVKGAKAAKRSQKHAILSSDNDRNYEDIDIDPNIRDQIKREIQREIKVEYDAKYEQMESNYKEQFQQRVKKHQKIQKTLERVKIELNKLQEAMQELERSKLNLIVSTSAEIDALRAVLRGKIDKL